MLNFTKNAYLAGSGDEGEVFKYKGPQCMKRVHFVSLSYVINRQNYQNTLKKLVSVHIKLHGIKKVVPVVYM